MDVRVLIIDEHDAARQTLGRRLTGMPGIQVVGSTGDGEEGLRQMQTLRPDLVLLDPKMRRADGMDVCRRACASPDRARVAVLTSFSDPEERRLARRAGICGYLLKDVDTPSVVQWIRDIAAGNGDKERRGNSLECCNRGQGE